MSKEIIISAKNCGEIIEALCLRGEPDDVTLRPTYSEVVARGRKVEEYLGIPIAALEGTEVDADEWPHPPLDGARLHSIQYRMRYHEGSWRLTGVYRADVRPMADKVRIQLSETAKRAILDKYSGCNH